MTTLPRTIEAVDFGAFRAWIAERDGVFDDPKVDSGEILRFRIGRHMGIVAARKSGHVTFAGIARPLYQKMAEAMGPLFRAPIEVPPAGPKPPAKVAKIVRAELHVDDHARARELLAEAIKAIVHTDGSCEYSGAGCGGWGAVIRAGFTLVEIYGGAGQTTVNRMELIAAIVALEILPAGCAVTVHTDSRYVHDGITKWIDGWKRRGWQTFGGAAVKNVDLWERLDRAREAHSVTWRWVKSHRGNAGNERADELARQGRIGRGNGNGATP